MLFSQNPIKLYSPIKLAGNKHFILNKIRPFIEEKMSENTTESIEMAGYFIYLNKRSFNELYRENQNGKYNVPYREYKNTKSKYFNENDVSFYCKSFNEVEIFPNSFVYLDPPYYESNTSSFTAYTKEGFTKQNHRELFEYCNHLNANGIKFLQSNSPCSEITTMYNSYNLR